MYREREREIEKNRIALKKIRVKIKKKKSGREKQRLELIFNMLDEGYNGGEIAAKLDRQDQWKKDSIKIGLESENRVIQAISALPYIAKISRHEKFSRYDRHGYDISVALDGLRYPNLTQGVFIQVKSSEQWISDFKRKLAVQNDFSLGQVENYMKRKRLIILNGRDSYDKIVREFVGQLEKVNRYLQV